MPDPRTFAVHNEKEAMRIWQILRAVDYKWTITQILEQPQPILDDCLRIESIAQALERQAREAENNG